MNYFVQKVDIPSNATKMEATILTFIRNNYESTVLSEGALERLLVTDHKNIIYKEIKEE